MSKVLEAMKVTITNAMELRAGSIPMGVLNAYYHGKVVGVLEVAAGGALSGRECGELLEYYESEKERLLY